MAYVDYFSYAALPASLEERGGLLTYGSQPQPAPAPNIGQYPDTSFVAFSPQTFGGNTDQFMRSIAGAQNAPFSPGISEPSTPLWGASGDLATMSIEGSLTGGGLAIGSPKVDDSFQSRMAATMALPDGQTDWGKWIIVIGVFVALYLIGRENGRKGQ